MVSFSFQPEFVPLIENGRKIQTIRKTQRCDVGDKMHLYTGLRTKQCKLIAVKTAVSVEIVIIEPRGITVGIPPCMLLLDRLESDHFAMRDGFENFCAMYLWFAEKYGFPVFHGFVHRWSE